SERLRIQRLIEGKLTTDKNTGELLKSVLDVFTEGATLAAVKRHLLWIVASQPWGKQWSAILAGVALTPGGTPRRPFDPDPSVRAQAARVLGDLLRQGGTLRKDVDAQVTKALVASLSDPDAPVRLPATIALQGLPSATPEEQDRHARSVAGAVVAATE